MGTWPTRKQYSAAVQTADRSFALDSLRRATFATDLLGLPSAANGQTAMVFQAHVDNAQMAVRVFTSDTSGGHRRYRALGEHLALHPAPAVAPAQWHDDAVIVDGASYPVVTMEWVEGSSLATAIEDHLGDRSWFATAADRWVALLDELRRAQFAHGDLQHGNVLVDPHGHFRLIDLDGVWVPAVAQLPPSEFGHPNFQHPDRTSGAVWGRYIDWFSALVIYTSLRALAADSGLWRHHHGDNLILGSADFQGGSPVWDDLQRSPDAEVRDLASLLAECCSSDPLAEVRLYDVLASGVAPSAPSQKRGRSDGSASKSSGSTAGQSEADDSPWWEDGASTSGGTPRSGTTGAGRAKNRTRPQQRAKPKVEDVRADWDGAESQPGSRRGARQQKASRSAGAQNSSSADTIIGGIGLSTAEYECVHYWAHGMSVADIARQLGLVVATVDGHLANVSGRVGVSHDDLANWYHSHAPSGGGQGAPRGGAGQRTPTPPKPTGAPPRRGRKSSGAAGRGGGGGGRGTQRRPPNPGGTPSPPKPGAPPVEDRESSIGVRLFGLLVVAIGGGLGGAGIAPPIAAFTVIAGLVMLFTGRLG